MKQTLLLENLTCARCASKIEAAIAQTEGYRNVSYNFATKKLSFETEKQKAKQDTSTTSMTTTATEKHAAAMTMRTDMNTSTSTERAAL